MFDFEPLQQGDEHFQIFFVLDIQRELYYGWYFLQRNEGLE